MRNFYLRRVLRIFPLYHGVLIGVFWVLPPLKSMSLPFQQELQDPTWYWTYLVNFRTAHDGWPEFHGLGHFWSLAVEEQFYLMWPVMVLLAGRRALLRVCGILILSSMLLRAALALANEPLAAYVLMPARMDADALAIGAVLAVTAGDAKSRAMACRWAPATGAAAAAALAAIGLWNGGLDSESFVVQTLGFMLTAILSGALLVIGIAGPARGGVRRALGSRPLRFLGHYSYGLYVFHNLLVVRIADHLFSVDQLPRFGGSQLPGQLLFIVIATATSLGLALLSWYCLEQPFLRLRRFFPSQAGALAPGN